MNSSKIYDSIALILWMAASWFFYLGYSNDFIASSMFFIPIIPAFKYRKEVKPINWDFKQVLSTFCYVGIGVGLHQVLTSIGGLSHFFQLLFSNDLIMVCTNGVFALLLLKGEVTNEGLDEQAVA
jgi:hypothetical protein